MDSCKSVFCLLEANYSEMWMILPQDWLEIELNLNNIRKCKIYTYIEH